MKKATGRTNRVLSYVTAVDGRNSRIAHTPAFGITLDDVVFRTGVSYDMFLEGPLSLAPMIAFNFGENDESVTLGASLLFRF